MIGGTELFPLRSASQHFYPGEEDEEEDDLVWSGVTSGKQKEPHRVCCFPVIPCMSQDGAIGPGAMFKCG